MNPQPQSNTTSFTKELASNDVSEFRLVQMLKTLRKDEKHCPGNHERHSLLGIILSRLGRQKEALTAFKAAFTLLPLPIHARNITVCLRELQCFDELFDFCVLHQQYLPHEEMLYVLILSKKYDRMHDLGLDAAMIHTMKTIINAGLQHSLSNMYRAIVAFIPDHRCIFLHVDDDPLDGLSIMLDVEHEGDLDAWFQATAKLDDMLLKTFTTDELMHIIPSFVPKLDLAA